MRLTGGEPNAKISQRPRLAIESSPRPTRRQDFMLWCTQLIRSSRTLSMLPSAKLQILDPCCSQSTTSLPPPTLSLTHTANVAVCLPSPTKPTFPPPPFQPPSREGLRYGEERDFVVAVNWARITAIILALAAVK